MQEIVDSIARLELLLANLNSKHEKIRSINQEYVVASEAGIVDDVFMLQLNEANRNYRSERIVAIESLKSYQELLGKESNAARRRGVEFFRHAAESGFSENQDEYNHKGLTGTLQLLLDGMRSLLSEIEAFNVLQAQIEENLKQLKLHLRQLEKLATNTDEDIKTVSRLEVRFADVNVGRQALLDDVLALLRSWQKRIDDSLNRKIFQAYTRLEEVLARLIRFGGLANEEIEQTQNIKEQIDRLETQDHEQLLEQIELLSKQFSKRAESARRQLIESVENLSLAAQSTIRQLHPKMPEIITLRVLLDAGIPDQEENLFSYWQQLDLQLSTAQNASRNAIQRFQNKIQKDGEYVFDNQDEVEVLGAAVIDLAKEPDWYTGFLWSLGAEILLWVGLSNLEEINEHSFYEQYGYSAIATAIMAATRHDVFLPVLSIFQADFLPPGIGSPLNLKTLLDHPLIQQALKQAIEANTLRLAPEDVYSLNADQQKVLLTLLSYKELELSVTVRLQWSALLHNTFELHSREHHQATHLLLNALLCSKQYISLYYALRALEPHYDDLWIRVEYRPLLYYLVLHAFDTQMFEIDLASRRFLAELCLHPGARQLAKGDFDSEFLLAALAHHATLRWDRLELVNEAWATWESLIIRYPIIAGILQRELQGEHFGINIVVDTSELKHQLDDAINDLTVRMARPGNAHPLGYQIHNWYLDNYMTHWLEQLHANVLPASEIDELSNDISTLMNTEDLIDATDVNLSAKTSGRRRGNLPPDKFRLQINRRLFELLEAFQQIVKLHKQINAKNPAQAVAQEDLQRELIDLYGRSQVTKWAIDHLLSPGLPFIPGLLGIE